MIRHINESISVAPQIAVEHVADIAAAGFKTIVNNRPDDEDAGQPSGEAIRAAAEAAGLNYVAIPVTHAGFSHPQIDAMTQALLMTTDDHAEFHASFNDKRRPRWTGR